jgi:hypothetical protein
MATAVGCLRQAASLQDSLRQREPDAQPYLDLAAVCEGLGRWPEAEQAYLRAAGQFLSHPEAEAALDRLFRRQGKSREELQQQLLRLCPPVPEIRLGQVRGGPVSLAALRGRVVLLAYDRGAPDDALASQLDTLEAWQRRWADTGLVVLYVADDWLRYRGSRPEQGRDQIPALAAQRGYPFPFAVDDGTLAQRLQVRSSTVFLIDRAGRMRLRLPDRLGPALHTQQAADKLAQLLTERWPMSAQQGSSE